MRGCGDAGMRGCGDAGMLPFVPFFTNNVMAMGVREPDPKILPPSLRDSSPLVR